MDFWFIITGFNIHVDLPGLQYSVFHGNNFQCVHSNPQKRTGNYSKGDHDLILISSSEAACGDSSAHILVLQSVFFFLQ